MNLRSVDLNLLVILDALIAERHVSRAAVRVGLSQPAVSNALKRLRLTLGDELLVRTARGMEPTPRALEMAEPVRQILRQAERLLESGTFFDPATSTLRLRLRMSDVLSYLLLPGLLAVIAREAPNLSLDVVHLPPDMTIAALERDEIDLAVSMDLVHPSSIAFQEALADRMVCVMGTKNPLARGAMTLERFLEARFIKVSMSPLDGRYVDSELSSMGRERSITVNVPHWLVVPHLIEESGWVAVMSRHLAQRMAAGLVHRRPPFAQVDFSWKIYWHRRNESVPANRWLRAKLLDVAAGVAKDAAEALA